MRCVTILILVVLGTLPHGPRAAEAQSFSIVGGALAGAGAGVWLSIAYITAQARAGDFVDSDDEGAGMAAVPLFSGLTAGLALGTLSDNRMAETLAWGAVGWASGIGVGALVGDWVWDDPQRRWAGGVIGGAVGMVLGGVTAFVLSDRGDETLQAEGVPLMFQLRF